MENNRQSPHETQVLTEEERKNFQGVTIDENGRTDEESTPSGANGRYESFGTRSGTFKVYTFSGTSLWKKILLGVLVLSILGAVIFFGGIFLIVFALMAVLGAVFSLFR